MERRCERRVYVFAHLVCALVLALAEHRCSGRVRASTILMQILLYASKARFV